MSTVNIPVPPPEFEKLSTSEQIEYVQNLWDIFGDSDQNQMPNWHEEIVKYRQKTSTESESNTWEEIKTRLTDKYRG